MAVKSAMKERFPSAWNSARLLKMMAQTFRASFGIYPRHCNVCGADGNFFAEVHFPDIFNFDAVCPHCGSLPRHRLLTKALDELHLITDRDDVLHFAPELWMIPVVKSRAKTYRSADLFVSGVDLKLNIERIDLPSESVDVVVCSHVLEHVNDSLALSELFRILRPGGRLIAMFPVAEGWDTTYENPAVVTPNDRALHFGKGSHVRRYGRDVRDRFAKPGFALRTFSPLGPEALKTGLLPGESVFIATRPQ
jgi:SAM-dependent methyltransferase